MRVDHSFNDWLSGDVTLRYYENTETQKYHEPNGLVDTDGDGVVDWSKRQYRDQVRHNKAGSVTANLVAELGDHTVLIGGDYYRLDEDYVYYRANVDGISLTDPEYGADTSSYTLTLAKQTDSRSQRYGAYVQDQWAVTERWNVLSGLRIDGYKDTINDIKAGSESDYTVLACLTVWDRRIASTINGIRMPSWRRVLCRRMCLTKRSRMVARLIRKRA